MKKFWNKYWIAVLVFGLIAIAGIYLHTRFWTPPQNPKQEDIYYSYLEGGRLVEGANPYKRILQSDMRTNDKYATYFPLFYLLSALTQKAGLQSYLSWLAFWRVVFLICNLGIGFLIFQICVAEGQVLLGLIGAAFWLFNRWTIDVTTIDHLDFLPLFLLLLSVKLVPRRFWWACILFSLSLAIKQIAILALPLYLIWAWQMGGEHRLKRLIQASALILAIPLVVSLPFLVWNAQAYVKSILFSATRNPEDHFNALDRRASGHLGSSRQNPDVRADSIDLRAVVFQAHPEIFLTFADYGDHLRLQLGAVPPIPGLADAVHPAGGAGGDPRTKPHRF